MQASDKYDLLYNVTKGGIIQLIDTLTGTMIYQNRICDAAKVDLPNYMTMKTPVKDPWGVAEGQVLSRSLQHVLKGEAEKAMDILSTGLMFSEVQFRPKEDWTSSQK